MRARPCARLPLLAVLAALAAGVAPSGASAAPAVDKAPKAAPGTTRDVAATASVTTPEADDAQCFTARRKLFVDGEGWIVRRITTCR
ncbi:hypothetical protein NS228_11800 [Methylobacterium indicum]|uniref:Uncharacterized protein n=1 Tax=Methylobacterium indicum TaxID=1775910 RepID=A0A8H8WTQ3_9HYPH|nr:hypothetical protein [Methylobacterium indicum]KTS26762.1 hypothetical protein NS229_18340 [Methylobacterium indicum]KTS40267.1 hypothetical protein NS228_11800 [Methylobacterium indicum]BCM84194.1 hypothetical protein mvi_26550 [Methylobacterium indicum]